MKSPLKDLELSVIVQNLPWHQLNLTVVYPCHWLCWGIFPTQVNQRRPSYIPNIPHLWCFPLIISTIIQELRKFPKVPQSSPKSHRIFHGPSPLLQRAIRCSDQSDSPHTHCSSTSRPGGHNNAGRRCGNSPKKKVAWITKRYDVAQNKSRLNPHLWIPWR